jgi:hypothetical protein
MLDNINRNSERAGKLVVLVEKQAIPLEAQKDLDVPIISSSEQYTANLAWLDFDGKILDTKELKSTIIDNATEILTEESMDDALRDIAKSARKSHVKASEKNETLATELFSDLTNTEFLKYYQDHKSTGLSLQQRQQGISYQEDPNFPEENRRNRTEITPFFDSNENLFSHVKTFLVENLADSSLVQKIDAISYNEVRDVFPANLPTIVIKKHNKHDMPSFKQEAELLATDVAHEIIRTAQPDYVEFSKEQYEALFKEPEKVDALFDAVTDDIADNELNRSQTHKNTSRNLLQRQYQEATNLLEHELSLRGMKSINFDREQMFVMQPAFSQAGQERQAENLSKHATADLVNALPVMLIDVTQRAKGQPAQAIFEDTERLLAVFQLAVSDKLLVADDTMNVSERAQLETFANYLRKAHDRASDLIGTNEKTTASFDVTPTDSFLPPVINNVEDSSFLEKIAAVPYNPETLSIAEKNTSSEIVHVPDNLTAKIISSRGAYAEYILDGVLPDKALPILATTNQELNAVLWNEGKDWVVNKIAGKDKQGIAETLNTISESLDSYQADSMYSGQYYNAQIALLHVADAHQIGIASLNSATQSLRFTSDYFMLPAKADAEIVKQLSDKEQTSLAALKDILAYNLLDVADGYKQGLRQPERTSVSFKDGQHSRTGQLISERLELLNIIMDNVLNARGDVSKTELWKDAVDIAANRSINIIINDNRGEQVKKQDARKDASILKDLLYQADIELNEPRGRAA